MNRHAKMRVVYVNNLQRDNKRMKKMVSKDKIRMLEL